MSQLEETRRILKDASDPGIMLLHIGELLAMLVDLNTPKKNSTGAKQIGIKAYLAECKEKGVKPIPPDAAVLKYAKDAGIADDFIALAFHEFVERMEAQAKRYKDWPKAFYNYVRGNYLKLWWINNDGLYELTSAGKQAKEKRRSSRG